MRRLCRCCYAESVPAKRWALGYHTCLDCGATQAKTVRHTIAPLNKSNYVYVGDLVMLKQLNPKRANT